MAEAYAMTVAFKTLLALVNSIDVLVKSTLKTEEATKVEGWIEPAEDVKTPDQTGVGTEAVENSNSDEGWYSMVMVMMIVVVAMVATVIHSQQRHRLDASCGFYRPDASCQQFVSSLLTSSSCIKSVNIRLAAT